MTGVKNVRCWLLTPRGAVVYSAAWFFIMSTVLAFALSGCASNMPASVLGGECRIFHDPGFAVRGKTLRDSQWVGRTQETGIESCGWRRPGRK